MPGSASPMSTPRERRAVQRTFDDMGVPLCDVTFCVIDFETTGGSADDDRITEVGAVKYRGGECLGTFQTLVNPGVAIPPYITMLTGITEAMVFPAPRIESILGTLTHFIGDSVIVAHNSRFDMGFLNAALIRDDRDPLTNKVVDTVPLARRLVGSEVPDCKLGTLASRLRLPHQPSHRALDDALTTADLLHFLLERAAGYGVLGLDDLIGLPRLDTHPQAAKLRLTEDLPRAPGVYIFSDVNGRILYVGKATNLRQRVRSYFSTGESRRKVGSMLRVVHRVDHIETPDPVTAEILEMRLIQRLLPQYNRAGTTSNKYCYVRLTLDEEWPRLVITKNPGTGRAANGLHIGPLTSRTQARLVVEAIESVVPLRRCTVRMGRTYSAPADAPVCSAAQLGVAMCPCSGTADPAKYADVVRFIASALTEDPSALFDLLDEKMHSLSLAQRYEEAANVRDRMHALSQALHRQRRCDQLRMAGHVVIGHGEVIHELHNGVLIGTRFAEHIFTPLAETSGPVLSAIEPLLHPSDPMDPDSGPLTRDLHDELMCVSRYIESHADSLTILECSGVLASSTVRIPDLARQPLRHVA
ncbi:MAG: DEDD exonuclease domain-containing protein [Ilumatobacteraceae bacterium]